MGGGTSNLFYGTKGSQKEYQYTLFVDEDFTKHKEQVVASSGNIVTKRSRKTSYLQEISAATIIKKCHEYYDGKLSAKQFVDWLEYIISNQSYRMEDRLRYLIREMLQKFQQLLLKEDQLVAEEFTLLVRDFENLLFQFL